MHAQWKLIFSPARIFSGLRSPSPRTYDRFTANQYWNLPVQNYYLKQRSIPLMSSKPQSKAPSQMYKTANTDRRQQWGYRLFSLAERTLFRLVVHSSKNIDGNPQLYTWVKAWHRPLAPVIPMLAVVAPLVRAPILLKLRIWEIPNDQSRIYFCACYKIIPHKRPQSGGRVWVVYSHRKRSNESMKNGDNVHRKSGRAEQCEMNGTTGHNPKKIPAPSL